MLTITTDNDVLDITLGKYNLHIEGYSSRTDEEMARSIERMVGFITGQPKRYEQALKDQLTILENVATWKDGWTKKDGAKS